MTYRQRSPQSHRLFGLVAGAIMVLLASPPALPREDDILSVNDLSWIVGTWEGFGPDDYSGAELTLSILTAPIEGVMSWSFRYHTPKDGHVHFAFTVIEDTEDGVIMRGIHYARDFRHYEDTHWIYRMTTVSATKARFECVESCRGAKSLTFEMIEEEIMIHEYELTDKTKPPSIFKYKRASRDGS